MRIQIFRLIALTCALVSLARAQSGATPSPAETFLRAFNTGDAGSISAYLHEHVAEAPPGMGRPGDETQSLVQLRSRIGPVALEYTRERPYSIALTAKAKSGWYSFNFMKAPPGSGSQEFIGISAGLAAPPKAPQQGTDAYLQSIAADGFFSGDVLVARADSAPFTGAYGLANRENHALNAPETRFNIASIGKLFTTAAVYQLVESRKLHLTDTIGQWLPNYPNKDASTATIQQLLDMRSGIGDIFNAKFMRADHGRIQSLQDYLQFFAAEPLLFPPGTGKAYSNGGFIVLGLIVEKASGEDFYSYVQRHIFTPAGMTHSAYLRLGESPEIRAVGYTRQMTDVSTWSTPPQDSNPGEPGRGSSAGGAYSTTGDLYKFAVAARNGTLVKGHYSWNGSGTWLGGAPGWNAVLSVQNGATTVVLSNEDPPLAENLVDMLSPTK